MREIELTNYHKPMIVDNEDYEKLSKYKWGVVMRSGKPVSIYTHIDGITTQIGRFLLEESLPKDVDHKNRNVLDNQKANLRWATRSQNQSNKKCFNSTGYRGVQYTPSGRYQAKIRLEEGIKYSLGLFNSPEEAAKAYDKMALDYYGEFAVLNFPVEVKE